MNKAKKDLETQKKVEKFNLSEVKTLLDDSVRKLMNEGYSLKEDHKHMNTKLLIGYPAAAIAGSIALYNWKVPFEECREIVAVGVVLYFILNSMLMAYIWFVEKDTIYIGKSDKKVITITSTLKNYNPLYKLSASVDSGAKKSISITKSIASWVDVDGNLAVEPFVADVSRFVDGLLK